MTKKPQTGADIKMLDEWTQAQFRAIEKAIVKHFLKEGVLNTHKGKHRLSILDTYKSIDSILGLAYTSSSRSAMLGICNVDLYSHVPGYKYEFFTISENGTMYANLWDAKENEILIEL